VKHHREAAKLEKHLQPAGEVLKELSQVAM